MDVQGAVQKLGQVIQDCRVADHDGESATDQGVLRAFVHLAAEADDRNVRRARIGAQQLNGSSHSLLRLLQVRERNHGMLRLGHRPELSGIVDDLLAVAKRLETFRQLSGNQPSRAQQYGQRFVHTPKLCTSPANEKRFRAATPFLNHLAKAGSVDRVIPRP